MTNDLISIQELKQSKVVTPSHEEIGLVDDVVIHKQSERVAYVIIKFGGIMGFGDKRFPIPFAAFYLDTKGKHKIILDVERERLEKAPTFDVDDMSDFDQAEFLWDVYKYYGLKPYLVEDKGEEAIQLSGRADTSYPNTIKEARFKNGKFDNNHNSVSDRHKTHHGF